jgi:hypothetical protein
MFNYIVDDQGCRYHIEMVSSAASSSGQKRQRWDLRTLLRPAPAEDVKWLRFETPHGPVTARLDPPTATDATTQPVIPERDGVEYYLNTRLYNHLWLHLLDPERRLARLSGIAEALVAVGSISPEHRVVKAITTVDDAISGHDTTALQPVLAHALSPGNRSPAWVGTIAVGVAVSHPDGAEFGLEALVGHPDRFALHFIEPDWRQTQTGIWGLIVTATDDHGRSHVAHPEPLSSPEEGAFHFRPPLGPGAGRLTVRLEGPTAAVDVSIDLTDSTAARPS